MSYLILEAAHLLKIPSNLAIRVHDTMDKDFLAKSVSHLIEDGTGPSYACSRGLDKGYARNGVPLSLARLRQKVGCNWTALPGIEYPLQDVTRLCLVAPFILAFDETSSLADGARSMDELWERYRKHLGVSVDVVKRGYDIHMERQAENNPELVLNLFCHGPVERGLDVSDGGVDLYLLNCDGVGLATVADSFAAVEQRVFKEKKIAFEELAACLENDFENAEDVRLMLSTIPRYGCGDSRADDWARRIAGLFSDLVRDTPTAAGYRLIPGLFSHEAVRVIGKNLKATPNGRKAGDPISHGPNPDFGFMPDGTTVLTAKAAAVAATQPGYGNTAPLQIEINTATLTGTNAVDSISALIMAHEVQGGTLININVISAEEILEAYEDPSLHPDLIVRVSGFSTYFSILPPESRKWVVDRVLMRSG
jgi:formate C-acetyltransferase